MPGGRNEKFVPEPGRGLCQGRAEGRQHVNVLSVLDKSEGREESLFQGAARDTRLQHDEILVQHGHNDEGKGDFI